MTPNKILYWMSAIRRGSWGRFRSAVERISPLEGNDQSSTDALPYHQRIRFALQQMGHVEFDTSECENGWRVTPPVIALTRKRETVLGVLCGARLPHIEAKLDQLRSAFRIEISRGEEHPDVLRVISPDVSGLKNAAAVLGVGLQPHASLAILSCLPPVSALASWHSVPTEIPRGRDWIVDRFDLTSRQLRWVTASTRDAECSTEGLFRFTRFGVPHQLLRQRNRTFRVGSQIGKYFLLAQRRRQLVRFDPMTGTFAVPRICRPPLLVDRALVLCSGFLPQFDPETGRLIYKDVPPEIAGRAAAILCQERI